APFGMVVVPPFTTSVPAPPTAPETVRDADSVSAAGAAMLHAPASEFADTAASVRAPASTFTCPSLSICENHVRMPPATSTSDVAVNCTSESLELQLNAPAAAATSSSFWSRNVDAPLMQMSPALQVASIVGRSEMPPVTVSCPAVDLSSEPETVVVCAPDS